MVDRFLAYTQFALDRFYYIHACTIFKCTKIKLIIKALMQRYAKINNNHISQKSQLEKELQIQKSQNINHTKDISKYI